MRLIIWSSILVLSSYFVDVYRIKRLSPIFRSVYLNHACLKPYWCFSALPYQWLSHRLFNLFHFSFSFSFILQLPIHRTMQMQIRKALVVREREWREKVSTFFISIFTNHANLFAMHFHIFPIISLDKLTKFVTRIFITYHAFG